MVTYLNDNLKLKNKSKEINFVINNKIKYFTIFIII